MTQKGALANYPLEEREAYLALVASLASIDGVVSNEEIGALRELCNQAGLGPRELGEVLGVAQDPTSAPLGEYVERLKRSELRFSLVRDLYALAQADQTVTDEEQREIGDMAQLLGVPPQQADAIAGYTRTQYRGIASVAGGGAAGVAAGSAAGAVAAPTAARAPAAPPAGYVPNPADAVGGAQRGGDWTSKLGSLGVPIAAVAAGGLLGGTGGAGLAGGAMALARGQGAGGALKHAAVGAAGFSGARWLLKKIF
jgi:uncharacterized tellurite resistance protein B-like protein